MVVGISHAVLVTGCSSGIGRATAERLVRAGHRVYATARRRESIADLEALGCRVLALDVTHEESMRTAVDTVVEAEGSVGVLVNNAGYGVEGPVEEVPIEEWRRQFETNVFGTVRLTQLVLPAMREQGWGRVITIGSMGGKVTFPAGGPYHASKYAIEAVSDALRFEVAGFGIDVVLVQPGAIRTGWMSKAVESVGARVDPGSPYAEFDAEMLGRLPDSYVGVYRLLTAAPDAVAQVVERAIEAERPRTRYPVTPMARVLLATRRLLPDRAWDALLRAQFSSPTRDGLRLALDRRLGYVPGQRSSRKTRA